jgi:uncharacterized membrane protein
MEPYIARIRTNSLVQQPVCPFEALFMLQQKVNAERCISTNSLVRFSKIFWKFIEPVYARFIANGEEPKNLYQYGPAFNFMVKVYLFPMI